MALAFVRGVGLVVADDEGRIWRVRAGGRAEKLGRSNTCRRALAADARGRLYVDRRRPAPRALHRRSPFRRTDVVDLEPAASRRCALHRRRRTGFTSIVPIDGAYEIRSYPIR